MDEEVPKELNISKPGKSSEGHMSFKLTYTIFVLIKQDYDNPNRAIVFDILKNLSNYVKKLEQPLARSQLQDIFFRVTNCRASSLI